ncbi:hypothetical protein [Syntrophomonas curvata]
MKGHIAFCPHFHQPHFQLYKTREEAYNNSYLPWLKLLQKAVDLDSFYVNLHFSGPFLYWIRDQKKEYLSRFTRLLDSGKIGIIGGLADEPFIQLSSRVDDYLYQLKLYDRLLTETIGIDSSQWQGIHLVERECGESMLRELTRAAALIQAPAVYYLDVETFYRSHFSYPGSDSDYCRKHFGFNDPVSITTISHIPPEMLFYALRDEIGGQAFHVLPIHSQFRYQLLKRNSFAPGDSVKIKPAHYYFYIKDALEKAYELVRSYGRDMEPVLLIFEDAEKFGQWSKDPEGDGQWLMEFFELVDKDPDISFTGLKDYLAAQGYLDSYPVASSHSYTEWENWTACRGIRGVAFGDERLRRIVCRLRDAEHLQDKLDKAVLDTLGQHMGIEVAPELERMFKRALLESAERHELVSAILKDYYPPQMDEDYQLLNRVRNLLYQEDPKWASRHPVYGSSPYYDVQGLAYLEMVLKILTLGLESMHFSNHRDSAVRDWDFDGQDEVVLENEVQTLVLDNEGGCISYHHVLAPSLKGDHCRIREIVARDLNRVPAYNSVFRYSYPLIFSETDSSLTRMFYEEGGRREQCRNSLRCEVLLQNNNEFFALGDFDLASFQIADVVSEGPDRVAKMCCSKVVAIGNSKVTIDLEKSFKLQAGALEIKLQAWCRPVPDRHKLVLVPQIVSTAAPSDEVEFRPQAWLGLIAGKGEEGSECVIQDISRSSESGIEFHNHRTVVKRPEQIDYIFQIRSADSSCFSNRIMISLDSDNPLPYLYIQPAVRHYYKNYVFPEQSRQGYHSAGLMIRPVIGFRNGEANCSIAIGWEMDSSARTGDYEEVFWLVGEKGTDNR